MMKFGKFNLLQLPFNLNDLIKNNNFTNYD